MPEQLFFGRRWEEIQDMQHKRHKHRQIDLSVSVKPEATPADTALLAEHGREGLAAQGLYGVLDRLALLK